MKNTKLLMALRGLQPTPIWIASTVLKNKGRKDIREFLAKVVGEGDSVWVVLEETVRDLRTRTTSSSMKEARFAPRPRPTSALR